MSLAKRIDQPGADAVEVSAGLAANVWKIVAVEGAKVAAGDVLIILESMKMEIPVEAPAAGMVQSLRCKEGDAVEEGQILAILE